MRREELDGEVSGSQIEQSAGELILLANISPADPPRLPLADHVQRIARSANSSSGNQTLIQCFKCCDRQSWLPTWMTFQGTTRSRKTGPMSILIISNDYSNLAQFQQSCHQPPFERGSVFNDHRQGVFGRTAHYSENPARPEADFACGCHAGGRPNCSEQLFRV